MRTPLTKVLVGTAVTATALLTVTGTASATTRTPTQLTIAASPATITVGHADHVTGALTANGKDLVRKLVFLRQFYAHKWHTVAAKRTNSHGDVAFYRKPRHSTAFKLVYRGNATYARTVSKTVHVTVTPAKKITTALSIKVSAAAITAGQKDTITGTLSANGKALPKKTVILDRWLHKRWIPIAARNTNATGAVKFTTRPRRSTSYRLVYHGNARYARSHSGAAQVTVTKTATALTASEKTPTIQAGQKDTITGTLTKGSQPLAKRLVWIYRLVTGKRPYPMRAHQTNANGMVSFTVKPSSTTTYELVYRGTWKLAGSKSSPVTVTVG